MKPGTFVGYLDGQQRLFAMGVMTDDETQQEVHAWIISWADFQPLPRVIQSLNPKNTRTMLLPEEWK